MARPILTLIRHGETTWSRSGLHTSRTELDLTPTGEQQARLVGAALTSIPFDLVLCSPRLRAQRTAELAGLVPYQLDEELVEWDYGEFEGQTTSEIQKRYPGWSIWTGPWPSGETPPEVGARADRVMARILDWASGWEQSDWKPGEEAAAWPQVALVGHGHFSRVLAARWVGEDVTTGAWLNLDTAAWSELGWYRDRRVVRHWNVAVTGPAPL